MVVSTTPATSPPGGTIRGTQHVHSSHLPHQMRLSLISQETKDLSDFFFNDRRVWERTLC